MLALANNWKTALLGATPAPPQVHLVSATFTPTPNTTVASLTEATFDGYASKTITAWGTTHIDAQGQQLFDSGVVLSWTPTGSTTPNTIYGYYLLDSAGNLLQVETFATPVLLSGTGTTLSISFQLAIRAWLASVVIMP